ncbi:AAA family ATPase [Pyxidicoccus sp. MSG2]|uniref:AAA family ATPase n=1 Tax=Pyxidicoccus sp. MSG2 TaxID=2996790 RepID=UPI00226F1B78|nr:AAA family ATPase [Pyxidicoccus sp. MSG2]MCY1016961.1 AAA family ATPase [Pyxidicoccus sp. MSG2]
MRLINFNASKVHGYLNFNINFNDNITFLVGLNGSGKTTALRLIMGLITPSLENLAEIEFDSCSIKVRAEQEFEIIATDKDDRISVSISGHSETFVFDKPDPSILAGSRSRHEYFTRLQTESRLHPVVMKIARSATPMFLGLDRRFLAQERAITERTFDEPIYEARQSVVSARHSRRDLGASLQDVQLLVRDTMAELRTKQEEIDGELRRKIIIDAFAYVPTNSGIVFQGPSPEVIASFKKKKASIEQAVGSLGVNPSEVEERLTEYFNRMEKVIGAFDSFEHARGTKKQRTPPADLVMEWIVNKPQVDRINTLFQMIERYVVMRAGVSAPIDNFLSLINRFLAQTSKKLVLSAQDYLAVQFDSGESRPLSALSSGERQIVVMLAHLSLNKRSETEGVFIVDEPELSLHIAWQEMFVDAIRQANPSVQLILATHSPAIILGRDDLCVVVGGVN